MDRKTIKYIALAIGLFLLVVIGIIFQRAITFANSFTEYKEHFNGACEKIYGVVGGEDITIDDRGIAWISAYDRRAVLQGKPVRGKIFTLDLNAPKPRLIERTPKAPPRFRPHGIGLFTDSDGTRYLFAVNHPTGNAHNILRFRIEPNNSLSFNGLFQAKRLARLMMSSQLLKNKFYYTTT